MGQIITEDGKKLRLERLQSRYAKMDNGPLKNVIGREIEIALGMWDGMFARRAELAGEQIPEVRSSVERQRRLTGATGEPERQDQTAAIFRVNRKVENPMLTPAQHQEVWESEVRKAERSHRIPDVDVTKIWAEENALSRLGALCFIRRRERHHEQAAERFKWLYEARYGAGVPAMDASRVKVDSSPIAHDSGMASKIDRTNTIKYAENALPKDAFDRIVALLILCVPAGEDAPLLPSGKANQRHVKAAVELALADLDMLADHWGMLPKAA
jgi:hypothetical protein